MLTAEHLRGCGACGQVQTIPGPGRWSCVRCGHRLSGGKRVRHRTAALALAGLIVYPIAITLPVMRIERFGATHEAGILDGTMTLLAHGEWLVGMVVLLASVVLPACKLIGLLVLDLAAGWLRPRMRARTWHLIELSGRWGMLDVLLVAVLAAALKLGDLVAVAPGPGAVAFTLLVVLSLIASLLFDPHALWEDA
ncbi:MAG: paraquat-inducible protein A [Planctomycetota bacterium]|jgi:paraquat-inducible protein A|nr:paraquat-inducible protein A [Planctomycetota bacterium]